MNVFKVGTKNNLYYTDLYNYDNYILTIVTRNYIIILGNAVGSPMQPRPSSQQIDGQNSHMTQSPMATQGTIILTYQLYVDPFKQINTFKSKCRRTIFI
jgi:hypothetical protein